MHDSLAVVGSKVPQPNRLVQRTGDEHVIYRRHLQGDNPVCERDRGEGRGMEGRGGEGRGGESGVCISLYVHMCACVCVCVCVCLCACVCVCVRVCGHGRLRCEHTHFFVCPGKYLRYLLSCRERYRMVSVIDGSKNRKRH